MSSILVAVFPTLVKFSVFARGYIIVALITLLLFTLGDYVRVAKNRFAFHFGGLHQKPQESFCLAADRAPVGTGFFHHTHYVVPIWSAIYLVDRLLSSQRYRLIRH